MSKPPSSKPLRQASLGLGKATLQLDMKTPPAKLQIEAALEHARERDSDEYYVHSRRVDGAAVGVRGSDERGGQELGRVGLRVGPGVHPDRS